MCIAPQDNSGRAPTAGQAWADMLTMKQNGFTSLDQLKQYQEKQRTPQRAAQPAPTPPQQRYAAQPTGGAASAFAPTGSALSIPTSATQLGSATRGSGLNIPS